VRRVLGVTAIARAGANRAPVGCTRTAHLVPLRAHLITLSRRRTADPRRIGASLVLTVPSRYASSSLLPLLASRLSGSVRRYETRSKRATLDLYDRACFARSRARDCTAAGT